MLLLICVDQIEVQMRRIKKKWMEVSKCKLREEPVTKEKETLWSLWTVISLNLNGYVRVWKEDCAEYGDREHCNGLELFE